MTTLGDWDIRLRYVAFLSRSVYTRQLEFILVRLFALNLINQNFLNLSFYNYNWKAGSTYVYSYVINGAVCIYVDNPLSYHRSGSYLY